MWEVEWWAGVREKKRGGIRSIYLFVYYNYGGYFFFLDEKNFPK